MKHRRIRRRRRHHSAFWLMCLIILLSGYGFLAYRLPLPVLAAQTVLSPAQATVDADLQWPAYGQAAIGAAGYGVLATHNDDKALPTASTAKMMTALAVLHKHPLESGEQGPILTLTRTDEDYFNTYFAEDGSVVKVAAGEKITEYEALEAMILPSANNMAESLAVWAFGSQSAYTAFADSYARTLGMQHAHFSDASGFSPQTTATASDLVRLGEASLHNPVLAQIVAEKQAALPVAGTVQNVNWQLGVAGINGIKTGSTDQDGGVFLFSAPRTYSNGQTVTVVGAIMGAKLLVSAMRDAIPLLDAAEANFKPATVLSAGQIVGHYTVPWGIDVDIVASKPLTLMTWQGKQMSPTITFKPLRAPFVKGMTAGTVTAGTDPSQVITLITRQAAHAPRWYWRAFHIL